MTQYILVEKNPDPSRAPIKIYLSRATVEVGRNTHPQLSRFPQVSRKHATFFRINDQFYAVQDLGSSNGVFVNGKRLGSSLQTLKVEDVISLGQGTDQGNGFVCLLKDARQLQIKHEVISISDDEIECKYIPASNLNSVVTNKNECNVSATSLTENHIPLNQSRLLETSRPSISGASNLPLSSPNKKIVQNRQNSSQHDSALRTELETSDEYTPVSEHSKVVNGYNSETLDNSRTTFGSKDCNSTTFYNSLKNNEFNSKISGCPVSTNRPGTSYNSETYNDKPRPKYKAAPTSINSSGISDNPDISDINTNKVLPSTSSAVFHLSSKEKSKHPKYTSFQSSNNILKLHIVKNKYSLKRCFVPLVKCDSKNFDWPPDVRNIFEKKTVVSKQKELNVKSKEKQKRELILNSSSSSDDNVCPKKKMKQTRLFSSDSSESDSENLSRSSNLNQSKNANKVGFKNRRSKNQFSSSKVLSDDDNSSVKAHKPLKKNNRLLSSSSESSGSDSKNVPSVPNNSKLCSNANKASFENKSRNVNLGMKNKVKGLSSSKMVPDNCSNNINKSQNPLNNSTQNGNDRKKSKKSKSNIQMNIVVPSDPSNDKEIYTMSYSQTEEVIVISDDESYLDFSSSQNPVHLIKEEPLDDEYRDDYRQIFEDAESCSIPEDTSIQDTETMEDIKKYIVSSKQKATNVVQMDNSQDIGLHLDCTEEKSSDDDSDDNTEVLCSANVQLGSELVEPPAGKTQEKSSHTAQTTLTKSVGRTLLTEPKPMLNRPRKIRGREEGFREQRSISNKKSSPPRKEKSSNKKLNKSKKSPIKAFRDSLRGKTSGSAVKIGNISADLSKFKIPRKKSVDADTSEYDSKLQPSTSRKTPDSISMPSVSGVKKTAAVKKRPDNFGSRMSFLTDDAIIKPTKNFGSRRAASHQQQSKSTCPVDKPQNSREKIQNRPANMALTHSSCTGMPSTSKSTDQNRPANMASTSSSRTSMPSTSKSTDIPVMKPVRIINPKDPRLKKLSHPQDRETEPPRNTISNSRSTEVVTNIVTRSTSGPPKTSGFKKPLSSNRCELGWFPMIKRLINLRCIWLQEYKNAQEKKNVKPKPPDQVSVGASELNLHHTSYESYVSSFTPMLRLEIWENMYADSKEVFESNRAVKKFFFCVVQAHKKDDCFQLNCQSVVAEKVSYSPREGSMVMIELKEKEGNEVIPFFGYVFDHRVENLDPDLLNSPPWKNLTKEWVQNAKLYKFSVFIKKSIAVPLGTLFKGNGLSFIRNKLRHVDTLSEIKSSPLLSNILNPLYSAFSVSYPQVKSHYRDYTLSQMRVIDGIASTISSPHPKIILVEGPPGTGKTHTIIGLLEKFLFNTPVTTSSRKILLVAPSNAAVDEMGCRLIDLNERSQWRDKKINFIRVGNANQINKKMYPYYLDFKAKEMFDSKHKTEFRSKEKQRTHLENEIRQFKQTKSTYNTNERLEYLEKQLKVLNDQFVSGRMDPKTEKSNKEIILKECHVVLSTLDSCALPTLKHVFGRNSSIRFSCCIIDESTQCTEVEALQPLVYGIDKLVLVGDPKQLPALVTSKLAEKYKFNRSLFERFYLFFSNHRNSPVCVLTEQFRMHSDICAFPSKIFYNDKLVTDPGTDLKYHTFPIKPYVVLNIMVSQESAGASSKQSCDSYGASSKQNYEEASVIINICKSLLSSIESASSIGIITPYQAQRSLYTEVLHKNPNYRDIEVNTVDGFQGREKEVIIFSCVRANSQSGGIGFLSSDNRLNVAITRAKKSLIICCHADTMKQDPTWNSLIEDARRRQIYFDVPSSKEVPYIFNYHIRKHHIR